MAAACCPLGAGEGAMRAVPGPGKLGSLPSQPAAAHPGPPLALLRSSPLLLGRGEDAVPAVRAVPTASWADRQHGTAEVSYGMEKRAALCVFPGSVSSERGCCVAGWQTFLV